MASKSPEPCATKPARGSARSKWSSSSPTPSESEPRLPEPSCWPTVTSSSKGLTPELPSSDFAITGGTGRYAGARGTFRVTEDRRNTRLLFTFLGLARGTQLKSRERSGIPALEAVARRWERRAAVQATDDPQVDPVPD